jgi:hypothetical protein
LDGSSASLKAFDGLNALVQSEPVKALIAAARAMPEGSAELRAVGLPPH